MDYSKILTDRWDRGFTKIFGFHFDNDLPFYFELVRAAESPDLKTKDLISFATAVIKYEREFDDAEGGNQALLILQERATAEVFEWVEILSASAEPEERQLAAIILRESNLRKSDSPYHYMVLNLLDGMAKREADLDVLTWIVSAIGWTHNEHSKSFLYPFVDHAESGVRFHVASNWIRGCTEASPFSEDTAQIAEKLCQDSSDNIRWYSYSNLVDLAREWDFSGYATEILFNTLVCKGLADSDFGVVKQAQLVIALQKFKGNWSGGCDYKPMSHQKYLSLKGLSLDDIPVRLKDDYEIASNLYDP